MDTLFRSVRGLVVPLAVCLCRLYLPGTCLGWVCIELAKEGATATWGVMDRMTTRFCPGYAFSASLMIQGTARSAFTPSWVSGVPQVSRCYGERGMLGHRGLKHF